MSGYIGASPLTQAVQKRQSFTATSGQTVFSFSYQPGYLDVFLNGVKMRDTEDYVATNGTSVTFNTGITLGGEVDLVTLSNFTPHDSYFKAESDARYEPIDSAYTKSEADARYLQSVASDSIGADELNVSGNGTAGQYLGSDGDGTMTWTSISSDPTMGGDLSGTASNAQIVANAVGTTEIANNAVTDAKISGMSSSKLSGALPAIDGSALTNMSGGGGVLVASSPGSGSFTCPASGSVMVTGISGGGSGAYYPNASAGGGAPGTAVIGGIVTCTPGASVSYSVGSGGAATSSWASAGNSGGATSVGGATINGGGGGYPNGSGGSAGSVTGFSSTIAIRYDSGSYSSNYLNPGVHKDGPVHMSVGWAHGGYGQTTSNQGPSEAGGDGFLIVHTVA